MRKLIFLPLIALTLVNGGCSEGNQAQQRQTQATMKMADEADRQTGMPAITSFSERKLVRDIYERRDRAGPTWAYLQGVDGRLTCLGRAMGYGVPYGAQFTAPKTLQYVRAVDGDGTSSSATIELMDQPEPNGLYMPDSASATWLQLVDPANGKMSVVYIEPNLTVSPFRIRGPIVAADCDG